MMSWLRRRQEKRVLELLTVHMNDPKSVVSQRVNAKANVLAAVHVMKWYDAKGIRHCAACPSTDTLRKSIDRFYCPTHYGKVTHA